jgi:CBS domain-containing protein/sporulation protein YlmC with PRC-barrel domain
MPGTTPTRVFIAALAGCNVFDPNGDQVGKVRDAVVALRSGASRLLGLVVEVPGRRRIFLPMTRVTRIDATQVVTTGVVNLRRFSQRNGETLALAELLDRRATLRETNEQVTVYDVGVEQQRSRDWAITKLAIFKQGKRFGRRGPTSIVDFDSVAGLSVEPDIQSVTHLMETLEELRPADLADMILELNPKRQIELVRALDDERLADVLEELPEAEQVRILEQVGTERAADVLEEMSPDDAADLIAELPPERAEQLLGLMDPDEAGPVRRLLGYSEHTAGGLMTSEPVILPPDATVADALAAIRHPELTPALAGAVFVCRPPLETPTGRLLGMAHFQRLLREMPSELVSAVVDNDLTPLAPDRSLLDVASYLAAYNLLSAPVVDDAGRLVGAVTVDDVLDHLLPPGWRDTRDPDEEPGSAADERAEAEHAVPAASARHVVRRRL